MRLPIFLRPEATQDVVDARHYYETRREGLGEAFLDRLNDVLARIQDMPKLYGITWRNVRAARLRRFKHVLYYRIHDDRVEVLGVLHGSRDSSVWRTRA